MYRKILLKLHAAAGLLAGFIMLLISLSGSLLVFHDELDGLQKPKAQFINAPMLLPGGCYAIMQQQYPHAEISSCQLPVYNNNLYSFFIYDSLYNSGKSAQEIFLHPNTGAVLGKRGGSDDWRNNFMGWLSKFHNSFNAGKTGEWLMGFFALVFLLSIVTGIFLYRKNIVAVILFKKAVWQKNNLHQLIGTWALLFNLLMGITGFWMQRYVFKKDFYTVSTWAKTFKASQPLTFNADEAVTKIKLQYPNFTPAVIYFAQNTHAKTAVYGNNSTNAFIHAKKFADVIALDSSGAIAKTRLINENTTADYYDIVNSQLHMGKFGGKPVKIIYGVLGITTALLSITGFLLWRKRKK